MDPVVAAFGSLMKINDRLLGDAFEGLTDEESWRHPGDANPIYWLAGHIARTRNGLARALGVGLELPWGSAFDMKTQPNPDGSAATLSDIRCAIAALSEGLSKRFAELSETDLAAPSPSKLPFPDQTIRGLISFLTFHEVYHVGQIAYVKKWLGYPGIVDGQ